MARLEKWAGQVALIDIGGKRHRFFIHDGNLTDYRSGFRFGDIDAIKIREMCRLSPYHKVTDRDAAVILVAEVIGRYGLDKVREQLAKHPTLNGPARG